MHGISVYLPTYIWLIFMANVGKYTNPMDGMSLEDFVVVPFFLRFRVAAWTFFFAEMTCCKLLFV